MQVSRETMHGVKRIAVITAIIYITRLRYLRIDSIILSGNILVEENPMPIICFANQKGVVGKAT